MDGCTTAPHVFKLESAKELQRVYEFRDITPDVSQQSKDEPSHRVLALDCEMIYTTQGIELARLSVVNTFREAVLDVIVQVKGSVIDYNTRWSGIESQTYASVNKVSLEEAQNRLIELMGPQTALAGHSLENDLKALRIIYTRCIDTCILYLHPRGFPYRYSLQRLTR